ncbi:hypothetical protein BKN38_04510 [Helicobacter sp. CLO-3]|nr:hypothetical protein BA723_03490 [Helicobacter sp. CLO-3]OHU83957.1 hypothetical protein BKN38_04510 [Helicobacter sp. CLO-3]
MGYAGIAGVLCGAGLYARVWAPNTDDARHAGYIGDEASTYVSFAMLGALVKVWDVLSGSSPL